MWFTLDISLIHFMLEKWYDFNMNTLVFCVMHDLQYTTESENRIITLTNTSFKKDKSCEFVYMRTCYSPFKAENIRGYQEYLSI